MPEATADTRVVVAAVLVDGRRLLAQQRAWPADVAGRWELPGGRVDPGESETDALARECREELGVSVEVGHRVGADVPLPNGGLLRVYRVRRFDGEPVPQDGEHLAVRWVETTELADLDWLEADRTLLPALSEVLVSRAE